MLSHHSSLKKVRLNILIKGSFSYLLHTEERKLFIGMIPHSYKEEDIKPMFEKYGTIEELNILKKPDGNSKGRVIGRAFNSEAVILLVF